MLLNGRKSFALSTALAEFQTTDSVVSDDAAPNGIV